jgi:4'-phosphopantetheinyl transferase
VEELVARFFSQRESDLFRRVAADQHGLTFFNLWTRKEALLKATGEGIAGRLKEFEVTLLPGEPARLLSIGTDRAQALDWSLHDLAPAPGFVGALALRANDVQLKCWKSQ